MNAERAALGCVGQEEAMTDGRLRRGAVILEVKDHVASRQMLKALLGYTGSRILEAADGSAALALARSCSPDLIISDIAMPVMEGIEFESRLRADCLIDDVAGGPERDSDRDDF